MSKRSKREQRKAERLELRRAESIPIPVTVPETVPLPEALERAAEAVERARDTMSVQPRFSSTDSAGRFFGSVYRWVKLAEQNEPAYGSGSMTRDRWLREMLHQEPFLAGVVHTISIIDQNRRWTLTGGRNQVNRYTQMFHSWNDGDGWRNGISQASQSFHSADIGGIVELGREFQGGPLRALYNFDPGLCQLTGNVEYPLEYNPSGRGRVLLEPGDFFRVVNMPATDEKLHGLGWCTVSRCLEMAKLIMAVWGYDHEQLGSRMPRGLLLLQNITQDQWDTAMQARDESLDSKNLKYYGALSVLATMGEAPDAKLIALAQLPQGVDQKQIVDLTMICYAMQTGYPIREFMPWESGTWGTAGETDSQNLASTTKGGASFVLGLQEKLHQELPPTLRFEFESRDDAQDLLEAQVAQTKIANIVNLFTATLADGTALLGPDPLEAQGRALSLLAQEKIVPEEWTSAIEDTSQSDTDPTERLLSVPEIRRACEQFQREPIVRYTWPDDRLEYLFDSGEAALGARKVWSVRGKPVTREDVTTITPESVAAAIRMWDRAVPEAAGALQAKSGA